MKLFTTQAIVLTRVMYGESDRIITVITKQYGKRTLIAKGARKSRSKLAGGIELFTENEITFTPGKGEIGTLISSRLLKHYPYILTDITRTMLGYEFMALFHKATESEIDEEYYDILRYVFEGLHQKELPIMVVQQWFLARLLSVGGHMPNLLTTQKGERLQANQMYAYDYDAMAMVNDAAGGFSDRDIKYLRILFTQSKPDRLSYIADVSAVAQKSQQLLTSLRSLYIDR